MILQMLTRILHKQGYTIDTAVTGHEALLKLGTDSYSAVLIDVMLGDMNGLDLLSSIQEISSGMLKIVLTGNPSDIDRTRALKSGADYYMSKPIRPERLVGIIDGRLRKGALKSEG